ncbi:MAG: Mur ligase family protein, partial [Firmicutes bacterium]|nr:Mur ligase family protein [Bacillota bacterium]
GARHLNQALAELWPELLAEMLRMRSGIAVAGAHGKTTTTGMIGTTLLHMRQEPTIVVGGVLSTIKANSCWGLGEYMVAEADESDGSFLLLPAKVAVVTNVENDHLDHYGSIENIIKAFEQFINQLSDEGFAVLGLDCPILKEMVSRVNSRIVSFALNDETADYTVGEINYQGFGSVCQVFYRGGTGRRFEMLGQDVKRQITVFDDYAHHPSEIKALLQGAKHLAPKRLVVVFQPHRYSRTQLLFREFASAFDQSDVLVLNEIYPAFEQPIEGVNSQVLAKAVRSRGKKFPVYYAKTEKDVLQTLDRVVENGDLVLIAGAGNIRHTGEMYAAQIENSH